VTAPASVLQVAVGLLHRVEGNVECLLLRKRATHPRVEFPGMWAFPGGKVDPGESCGAALVREVREECGVEIVAFDRIGSLLFTPPDTRAACELIYYDVLAFRGEAVAVEADTAVRWMAEHQLVSHRSKLTIGTTRLYDRRGCGTDLFRSGGLPAAARWRT